MPYSICKKPRVRCFPFLLAVVTALSLLLSAGAAGQGNLLLYPKRIVFEGGKKSQTLNLANSGGDTVRYLISVVQMRMKEDGSFEAITQPDSGQQFATPYFRFFPRSVVLGPGEAQSVKLQVVGTAGLAVGEYRSHIYFRAEGAGKPLGQEGAGEADSGAISVRVVAVFGISLPVIIRVGAPMAEVGVSAGELVMGGGDSAVVLPLRFERRGESSVYGDVSVEHVSPGGKVTRVGLARGMALYTPNGERRFKLGLEAGAGVNYHKGRLRISYTTPAEDKARPIAHTELILK